MILFLHLCLLWMVLGAKEAILYSGRMSLAFRWNEHGLYVVERILILLLPWHAGAGEKMAIGEAAAILSFAFFHNGAYYQTRTFIDGSYRGWWDMTRGSSAKINLTLFWRTLGLVLGLGFLLSDMIWDFV